MAWEWRGAGETSWAASIGRTEGGMYTRIFYLRPPVPSWSWTRGGASWIIRDRAWSGYPSLALLGIYRYVAYWLATQLLRTYLAFTHTRCLWMVPPQRSVSEYHHTYLMGAQKQVGGSIGIEGLQGPRGWRDGRPSASQVVWW